MPSSDPLKKVPKCSLSLSLSLVKDFSFIMMNNKISRRFMSSISSSLRRSMSSISVLSTNEEEEEIFENDFLFKAVHFSQNRGNEINQILLNLQQMLVPRSFFFPLPGICNCFLFFYGFNKFFASPF